MSEFESNSNENTNDKAVSNEASHSDTTVSENTSSTVSYTHLTLPTILLV